MFCDGMRLCDALNWEMMCCELRSAHSSAHCSLGCKTQEDSGEPCHRFPPFLLSLVPPTRSISLLPSSPLPCLSSPTLVSPFSAIRLAPATPLSCATSCSLPCVDLPSYALRSSYRPFSWSRGSVLRRTFASQCLPPRYRLLRKKLLDSRKFLFRHKSFSSAETLRAHPTHQPSHRTQPPSPVFQPKSPRPPHPSAQPPRPSQPGHQSSQPRLWQYRFHVLLHCSPFFTLCVYSWALLTHWPGSR